MKKISILRQFGTEQFSMSSDLPDHATTEEIAAEVAKLGGGVSAAFIKVCEREDSEKAYLAKAAQHRTDSNKALEQAIKDEMEAAASAKRTIKQAEFVNKKK